MMTVPVDLKEFAVNLTKAQAYDVLQHKLKACDELLDLIDAAGGESPMNVSTWIEFHWEPIVEKARRIRCQK